MKKKKRATGIDGRKMTLQGTRQLPISVKVRNKTDMRTQFGALCWRVKNGAVQVLMITSRGTNRWIIPKGWPMQGLTPCQTAMQEAWEEAGVEGKMSDRFLGLYSYVKKIDKKTSVPCVVMVYPVKVARLVTDFPEAGQRKRKWVAPKKAAAMVHEPELAHILKNFDPRHLKG